MAYVLGETPSVYARRGITEETLSSVRGHGHVLHVLAGQAGEMPAYVAALARGLHSTGLRVSVACGRGAALAGVLREDGVPVLELDLARPAHSVGDAAAARAIVRFCHERAVSVLHGHGTRAGVLVALAGARCGVPSLYTPHGWAFEQPGPAAVRAARAAFERRLVRGFHTGVITMSDSGRAAAERWRVASADSVRVIPTGSPPLPHVSRAAARARLGLGPDEVVAAWVGWTGAQKRPEDLITVARRLQRRVRVVALCAGAAGSRVAHQLRAAGVRLLDSDVEPAVLYGAADMMVQTSAWEATSLAVLEAMGCGLPVIAYDVGGVGEQVLPGRTGYLVAPGDTAMLCECALALAQRPHTLASLGAAAAHRARTEFGYGAMVHRFLAVYRELGGATPLAPAADDLAPGLAGRAAAAQEVALA